MPWGRTGAADQRNLEDSKGQQEALLHLAITAVAVFHQSP